MWLRIYELFWCLSAPFLIPLTLYKDTERYKKRWGLYLPTLSKGKKIWIHALSVGEVLSATSLIKEIKKEFPFQIIFTTTTKKGMEVALKNLKKDAELITFFPFDFFWSAKRFISRIRPEFFILVETDLWPYLINQLSCLGIKSFLVNGRISPKSFDRYRKVSFFIKDLLNCFELCMVQSEADRKRFLKLGVKKEKLINTGNIKFDKETEKVAPSEKEQWRRLFGIKEKELVWIAGSTHPGEEEKLLWVQRQLKDKLKDVNVKLIIAPRHIERALQVLSIGREMGFNIELRSKLSSKEKDVIVLDTIGELSRIYSIADVAFVGGSLVPFGGHNLIEPASFGCPVIFGPHVFNFQDIADALKAEDAALEVKEKNQLFEKLLTLFLDKEKRADMGKAALRFIQKNRGATKKVVSLIKRSICGDGV